jgi:hypothetical protein
MYFDPTGEIAWVIVGAVVGGITGAAVSYYTTGSVDWKYVVGGALIGAGGVTAGSTGYDIISNANDVTTAGEYISNDTLYNIYSSFYKGVYTVNPIGNGSTAAAINYTETTGNLVGGSDHM